MFILKVILMVLIGIVAVIQDVRSEKISNWLILIGLILGLSYDIEKMGARGILFWLGGMSIPFVFLFILYFFRTIGSGDIKLFCVFGSFLGIFPILKCIIVAFLIGAVMSLGVIIWNKNGIERLSYLGNYIMEWRETKNWRPYYAKEQTGNTIHFSIPITISMILYLGGVF